MTLAMLQALIPLGLRAVEEALIAEVTALAGPRYAHDDEHAGLARLGSSAARSILSIRKSEKTIN
ncbi:MAG: hypothetical protein WKF55_07535 [Gemmatimonadaceae bacterium]